jgi:capsular exopolysaccharide synthesis family protein
VSDLARLSVAEPSARPDELAELGLFEARTQRIETVDPILARVVAPGSLLVETFRVLRAKVESIGDGRLRCLGVVASAPGQGATTTAVGLAVALAREGARRVLLVEATLRQPNLERRLGLEPVRGLTDWLSAGTNAALPLRRLEPWGVYFLGAGAACPEPAALLESEGMDRLLNTARRTFDYTVIDCPPLTPRADSVLIQDRVDGFLLVVRARGAARERIQEALSQLKPDRVQGVVYNDHHPVFGRRRRRRADRRPT